MGPAELTHANDTMAIIMLDVHSRLMLPVKMPPPPMLAARSRGHRAVARRPPSPARVQPRLATHASDRHPTRRGVPPQQVVVDCFDGDGVGLTSSSEPQC